MVAQAFGQNQMTKPGKNVHHSRNAWPRLHCRRPVRSVDAMIATTATWRRHRPRTGTPVRRTAWAGLLLFLGLLAVPAAAVRAEPLAPLVVAVDDNYPPYVFRDADGHLQGILKDLWDLWSRKTGIPVQIEAGDWAAAQARMEAGDAHVLDTLFRTPARERQYDFSAPYATIDVPVFFHRDLSGITQDPASLRGFTVGAKDRDACVDWLRTRGIDTITPYPSYEALVQAAARGDVRVFCLDKPPALYLLYRHRLDERFRQTPPLYAGQFHWAVRKGDAATYRLVENGFAQITQAERDTIEQRWLGAPLSSRLDYGLLVRVALAVAAAAALLLAWNWSLRRQVAQRTRSLMDSEARFRTIFDNVNDAIFIHDISDGRILFVNQRMREMYRAAAIPTDELTLDRLSENAPPYDMEAARARIARAVAGQPQVFDWHARTLDGTLFWAEIGMRRAHIGGLGDALLVVARDITERRDAESALRESAEHLGLAARLVGLSAFRHDGHLRYTSVIEPQLGLPAPAMLGRTDAEILSAAEAQPLTGLKRQAMTEGVPQRREISLSIDGEPRHLDVAVAPVRAADGAITGLIGASLDITERKAAQARMDFLAHHDPLTRLPNRLLARDRFHQATSRAERQGRKVAVMVLDLDHFKTINDTLGHPAGDSLLLEVAQRLGHCLRDTDTVSRQGGDEFLVLLPDLHESEEAGAIAEKIVAALAHPVELHGRELGTSMSVGIAIHPDDGADFDTLMKKADTALYSAKEAGRNTYRFFDPRMNVDALEHLAIRNDLRRALERDEFVLHYQPQVAAADGRVLGAEALVRWNHPTRGLVPPGSFIAIAEDCGLIVPLGEWVLRRACADAAEWWAAGHEVTVAVNLSALQFKRGNLEDSVRAALHQTGLSPGALELELTESILIKDTDNVLAKVRSLHAVGVELSIDDFGTGYSSLSYLQRFQVDKLKIDQSFVRALTHEQDSAAIVTAIIQMAHGLNLKTIAEGVEDDATLAALRRQGCDQIQGYLTGRPMPVGAFREFLAAAFRTNRRSPRDG